MDRRLLACVAIVFLATAAFAAEVKISIHPALQGYKYLDPPGVDHPVISTTSHNSQQLMTQVEVTNYSTKAVSQVEYGWRIAASAKCTGHKFPAKFGKVTQTVAIAPGKSALLPPPAKFDSNEYLHKIIDEADLTGAHAVIVTLGIVKVVYSDGTTWEDADVGPKNMFDGGLAETVESCTVPTTTTSAAPSRPHCQNVTYKLKDAVWESNALDQCWPTPARGCTGRQIIAGDCPFEDCVIVGCGVDCSLTWTVCSGSWYPLNCNSITH